MCCHHVLYFCKKSKGSQMVFYFLEKVEYFFADLPLNLEVGKKLSLL